MSEFSGHQYFLSRGGVIEDNSYQKSFLKSITFCHIIKTTTLPT